MNDQGSTVEARPFKTAVLARCSASVSGGDANAQPSFQSIADRSGTASGTSWVSVSFDVVLVAARFDMIAVAFVGSRTVASVTVLESGESQGSPAASDALFQRHIAAKTKATTATTVPTALLVLAIVAESLSGDFR